jgi:immune inhibitor A
LRITSAKLISLVVASGAATTLLLPSLTATAAPPPPVSSRAHTEQIAQSDDQPGPLEEKRRALRQQALTEVLNGTAKPQKRGASTVVKVSSAGAPAAVNRKGVATSAATTQDQYVELSREKTDKVFVVLTEFGNTRDPKYPDKDIDPSTPGPVRWDGPLHNQIPKPDRSQDNTTVWEPDYSRAFFQNLYFGTGGEPGSGGKTESVRQYYERQSSGRYSIDGTVTNWVKVKYNEARYGRSSDFNDVDPNVCADIVCDTSEDLVRDGVNQWYSDQIASGRSKAAVVAELKSFDQWDRYDVDHDGNFNEPDGYIDHFQILHAGGDEANGDPIQGEDAIWSHRGFAYQTDEGVTGPAQGKAGGTQIGDSGLWVGDYTMQPENGGMSVIAHEYGHDLGLPDLYDTENASDNSVNWWSLMAQSRESAPGDNAIGTRASDFGAWEKLQLGWLDYETVLASQNRTIDLGPHEYNSAKAQGVVVVEPKKTVTRQLQPPYAGQKSWWSGTKNDYTATMTRSFTLPAGTNTFSFRGNYNIEDGYDYAYVQVNDGSGFKSIPGTATDPDNNNGITGDTAGKWVPMTYDLSAYSGKTVQFRLRYRTDGGVQGNDGSMPPGLFADELTLTNNGKVVARDGAESSPNGWDLVGFSSVGSSVTGDYPTYYIASNRAYTSFDKYLQTGPYRFGWQSTQPNRVEHFPYQNGLLISYWDTSQEDNNTGTHPGSGLILPVDANPRPPVRLDGNLWQTTYSAYDAPFGLEKSDSLTLHINGEPSYIRGQPAVPLFHDNASYWTNDQPEGSVKVPNKGTNIKVLSQNGTSMRIKVYKR